MAGRRTCRSRSYRSASRWEFLFGAALTFIAVLAAARLLTPWHPVFDVPGFGSASRAGMWLAIDRDDPRFDALEIASLIARAGGDGVLSFGGEP